MTLPQEDVFDLSAFLPYILNQAAEATSRSFQPAYTKKYGMTRTQWRVIANIGKFGAMTAKQICDISHLEKTKVSRAITMLEGRKSTSKKNQFRRPKDGSLDPYDERQAPLYKARTRSRELRRKTKGPNWARTRHVRSSVPYKN